ncbi:enoyl-CoA hydratase/isomerase family protein [Variovorax ginsengisoli]|uniref:Enoyl-CoA hydratase/carnithine racemase n=1 Tax=Variovorax ginsengisoli TaxID=363844 RepID=A0ABT9SES9_9BURK|nr:enoyl-CoA hydratase/isomerase family protein [Variovorax ginsengisoli]MDP9902865.1 enoyl-CoA hydratase/carnithine racemase [Variovorax ginsengisoli]
MTLAARHDGGLEWLSLSNPPVNALTVELIEELIRALGRCANDPNVSVVVLAGIGKHFCAGADLAGQQRAWREGRAGPADLGDALYDAMLSFPKPLVGAAHGSVAGAGLSMLCCCDLAIAASGTRISLPEVKVGVLGGISHARTALGKAIVNYLALTGLPLEVERIGTGGLFLEIVDGADLQECASQIARKIADNDSMSVLYTKQCTRATEGIGQLEGYSREHALSEQLRAQGTTDLLVTKFLTK